MLKLLEADLNKPDNVTTILEYTQYLETLDHAVNESDLLRMYEEKVDYVTAALPKVFHEVDIPKIPVFVRPLEFDGPEGMYSFASATSPGIFLVNTNNAADRPTFTQMSLTLHESNPGHHLQVVSSLSDTLPEFRQFFEYSKTYAIPSNFPFYNSYIEGWALYSETLHAEQYMNVTYGNIPAKFGILTWEMFRACRLVVDVAIHYGLNGNAWSRNQALEFISEKTGMFEDDIKTEIDRYSTWPGQATGYKIGQLKILELRDRAISKLGEKYDIKDFHHVILSNGAMNLELLEKEVNKWISNLSDATKMAHLLIVTLLMKQLLY